MASMEKRSCPGVRAALAMAPIRIAYLRFLREHLGVDDAHPHQRQHHRRQLEDQAEAEQEQGHEREVFGCLDLLVEDVVLVVEQKVEALGSTRYQAKATPQRNRMEVKKVAKTTTRFSFVFRPGATKAQIW